MPLVGQDREPFDSGQVKNRSKDSLIKSGILPAIKGLYVGDELEIDTILLSHPHQDHYGLHSYVNPKIPVYMSKGCKILIKASHYFGQTDCRLENAETVESWKPFKVADFTITPYLVDHSGFDALAFMIEADGMRVFYSGDFRGHGRKAKIFDNLLERPPKDIDYLILEGSMIGRAPGKYKTEADIEEAFEELFKADIANFLSCSSQNIDRLVSAYRACLRTDRMFVIDPYTAYILDKLKIVSPRLPQHDWRNIRVFIAPNSYTKRMAEDKSLFRFSSAKITFPEIIEQKDRVVIKDNFLVRTFFMKSKEFLDAKLIYSMWEGYLPDLKPFWDRYGIPILKVHGSGHAYIDELKGFVSAIRPKTIIPNHTFHPNRYKDIFEGCDIMELKDGQKVEL
jgi:ribonuclease J